MGRLRFSQTWSPTEHQTSLPKIDEGIVTPRTVEFLEEDLREMLVSGLLAEGDLARCAQTFEICLEWGESAVIDMVAMTAAATCAPSLGLPFRQAVWKTVEKYGFSERFSLGKDSILRVGAGGIPGPSQILSNLHRAALAVTGTGRTGVFRGFRDISSKLGLSSACSYGSAPANDWTWLFDRIADRTCHYLRQEQWSLHELKSLITRGFRYRHCFLSYAHDDMELADQIAERLRRRGVKCWLDRERLVPGQLLPQRIQRAIEQCDCMLVLITPSAYQSRWVASEILFAMGKEDLEEGRLIPVNFGTRYEPSRFDFIDEESAVRRLESVVAHSISGEVPSEDDVDRILLGLREITPE